MSTTNEIKKANTPFILDAKDLTDSRLIQQCFDVVGVFVMALDLEGRIILVNNKGKELLGFEEDEIIGKSLVEDFMKPEDQEQTRLLFEEVLDGRDEESDISRFRLKNVDGKSSILEARNMLIHNKDNQLLGILISGKDITSLVKSQDELQNDLDLYRVLASNIPDINLFLFNKELRFILAEGSEMKNNGFTRKSFEGKLLTDISSEATKALWEPLFLKALSGKEISTEYKYNNYYYLIWVVPLRDSHNETYAGIAITQNITDDKRIEQKLKRSKENAEKANRAKSEFLARVSHEIRTPLNAILGFTEQLHQTHLNKKQTDYVKIIDKSSEHLLSLINDILILSKIEARQINFEHNPFKVEHTIKYVHNALLVKAREKNLSLTYEIDENLDQVLLGDSFRLRQILMNMVSNAVKFTHSGYVELRCFMVDENDNEVNVRFDIIDTGIGIKSDHLKTIFEQFQQADSSITKQYGGTGLGLTICKNLIEMQNGNLSVSSQERMGSTFTFIIPYKKGKETDIIPESMGIVDSEKLQNKRVLLVDDDSVNRLLGKTILEKFACQFDIAINGSEAIQKLKQQTYDIVLLDIHMPDISGTDVARFLRFDMKDTTTKMVAVTAAVMKDDIQRYYKAGINDFLVKPFKEIYLFNKMCEVLQIQNKTYPKTREEIILKEALSPKSYDLSELKRMTGNSKEMINQMIFTFLENSDEAITSFQSHLTKEDWNKVGEVAHKLLPSYRHLEVRKVTSQLTEIKTKTLVKPDYLVVPALVKNTIAAMKKVMADLKSEIK